MSNVSKDFLRSLTEAAWCFLLFRNLDRWQPRSDQIDIIRGRLQFPFRGAEAWRIGKQEEASPEHSRPSLFPDMTLFRR